MNKKLLAVAVAGVLAAPLAQAQTANVTLYGRLNLDAEVIINAKQDNTSGIPGTGTPAAGSKQNVYRVSSNSSRLGVKGTESLGGGLNAIFQIESSINADASGGTLAGRETFVGLQGGWGTLKLGYFLAPYDDIHAVFGNVPTLLTSILATSGLWSNAGDFDSRVGNSVRYDSPNISGFTGGIQIGDRDVGNSGTLDQQRRHAYILSTGGQYNNGPIRAGFYYEVHNNVRDGSVAYPKLQDQAMTAAGSYNFGVIKVGAMWERVQYDAPAGGDMKRDMWGISGTGNLGPGQYYIGYFNAGDGKGSAADGYRYKSVTKGNDTCAQMWEVSYTYPLSKRTLLYTGYIMVDNDKNGAYNFGVNAMPGMCTGNGASCGDSGKPQGFTAGMVHFF
jgi:predicted porin